jgi:hypothetical protein
VNEPADLTGWVDRFGDTWVRVDELTGRYGPWWPLTDGPHWDDGASAVGNSCIWAEVEEYGPFTPADPARTAAAIDRVRRAAA